MMKAIPKKIYDIVLCVLMILMMYMILVGMNGTALSVRQEVFTYPLNTPISKNPSTYLKGVTDPDRVHMDLSAVDNKKQGIYTVRAKQASRTYEFKIEVK